MSNQNSIVITITNQVIKEAPVIISSELFSLDDICTFIKEQCEAGVFDGHGPDVGRYTGSFEVKDKDDKYRVIIGYHESECRSTCKMAEFAKNSTLKEMADSIIKAVPDTDDLRIVVDNDLPF